MKQLLINIIAIVATIICVFINEHRNKHKLKNSDVDDILIDKMASVSASLLLFLAAKYILRIIAEHHHLT